MAKLWDKGYTLDSTVERFTVGRDFILDRELVVADAMASIAHARMLAAVSLLPAAEADALVNELRAIARDGRERTFAIRRADEDCHTAIETRLVTRLGDAGKRVHTGRSRNDQITAATRLYTREYLSVIQTGVLGVVDRLLARAEEERHTVMPGRTHLQVAMLSTFGFWLASWAEQLLDNLEVLEVLARLNDRSPLGSAASYGTPLPLDREMVAEELGFAAVQNNALAVQHSRGGLDGQIAAALAEVAATFSRMAQDLILFSLPEIGYVTLPESFCSGSSIMPQKRNPDVLELMRSRASVLDGYASQCRGIVRSMPSGYNRDLQDTKEPLLRALHAMHEEVAVGYALVDGLVPNRERMKAALNTEVFATDFAYQLVEEGVPFRDAYRTAAASYGEQELPEPLTALERRRSTGTPGRLNLDAPRQRYAALHARGEEVLSRHRAAIERTLGSGWTTILPRDPRDDDA